MRCIALCASLLLAALCCGCGTTPAAAAGCTPTGFLQAVGPADPTVTPDHTLPSPGNQEFYTAGLGAQTGPHCVVPQLLKLTAAQWSSSDPANVKISSALDASNGQVTCLGATAAGTTVSATLSAYGFTQTMSSPVSCK